MKSKVQQVVTTNRPLKILSIETSCDETAVAIIEAGGGFGNPKFKVISQHLYSQASKHAEYGGVYPNLAKREHGLNLIPLLREVLKDSDLEKIRQEDTQKEFESIQKVLERNPELLKDTIKYLKEIETPDIDAIAVTVGPGLEPALWVGISLAQSLGQHWDKPVFGTNHMEGHIYSVLINAVEN